MRSIAHENLIHSYGFFFRFFFSLFFSPERDNIRVKELHWKWSSINFFSRWVSFNSNFLPFQVINLRLLDLRECYRSLERMLSDFNKENKMEFFKIYFLSQTFAVCRFAVFFVWRIRWVFHLGRRDNSYKNHCDM